MKKRFVFVLVLVLASSSLMVVKDVHSVLSPSVPDFTVKYVDNSYFVPPTYGIDQYTGATFVTKAGYPVDGRMIEFTVTNQPFTPYDDSNSNNICLYYNFRYKGHYSEEWSHYPFKPDGYSTLAYGLFTEQIQAGLSPKYPASSTAYTTVTVNVSILDGLRTAPVGAQVDFQVQAIVGHIDYEPSGLLAGSYYKFVGETGDWSATQALTIGDSAATASPTPSPTASPTPAPSPTPTASPTASPSPTPTPSPEATPSPSQPTSTPTVSITTKPSFPEFTLKLEAHPYDMPATYEIDPYTGENVTTQSGYHVENKTIEVTIRNHLIRPDTASENSAADLHYVVRIKGSFDNIWSELGHIHSSGSAYTQVSYTIGQGAIYPVLANVPVGGKLDFQVMALAGYYTPVYATLYQVGEDFHGETSGWSNTQTITIGASNPAATPNTAPSQNTTATPTPSGSQNGPLLARDWEHFAIIVLSVMVAVLLVVVIVVVVFLHRSLKPAVHSTNECRSLRSREKP